MILVGTIRGWSVQEHYTSRGEGFRAYSAPLEPVKLKMIPGSTQALVPAAAAARGHCRGRCCGYCCHSGCCCGDGGGCSYWCCCCGCCCCCCCYCCCSCSSLPLHAAGAGRRKTSNKSEYIGGESGADHQGQTIKSDNVRPYKFGPAKYPKVNMSGFRHHRSF